MNRKIIPLKKLPLKHHFMFDQVMKQPTICKLFLEELLSLNIEKIQYVEREKELNDGYLSKGIRLDLYIRGSDKIYNIEMQSGREPVLTRRIRYYQSGVDRHELLKGMDYEDLPESFIIFICDYDPFGEGLAVYERNAWFKNTSLEYDDGTHAIILNSRYRQKGNASESILEFLDYIRTDDALTDPSSELVKQVKKQVNAVRLDAELGVKYMTLEMKIRDERRWAERQATERLNKLNDLLLENQRIDDLKRSVKDKAYQKKLLKEYNLL